MPFSNKTINKSFLKKLERKSLIFEPVKCFGSNFALWRSLTGRKAAKITVEVEEICRLDLGFVLRVQGLDDGEEGVLLALC